MVTEPVNQRHDIGSGPRRHFQGSAGEYVVPQAWLDPACNGAQPHPTKAGFLQEHVGGGPTSQMRRPHCRGEATAHEGPGGPRRHSRQAAGQTALDAERTCHAPGERDRVITGGQRGAGFPAPPSKPFALQRCGHAGTPPCSSSGRVNRRARYPHGRKTVGRRGASSRRACPRASRKLFSAVGTKRQKKKKAAEMVLWLDRAM